MSSSERSDAFTEARRKFLGLSLESTRKSYYPQLKAQLVALRESEAKYRELVQHAPAGIFEIDLERLRFTRVNPVMCHYTGYSEEEFKRLDPFTLLDDAGKKKLNALISAIRAGTAAPATSDYALLTKDGRQVTVLVNVRLFFENGKARRAMAVAHDVTAVRQAEAARKQLEIKLQETQKLESLGTLAGGIAHDFNNLLMGIQGNASLALLDLDPGGTIHQRLKNIETYVQQGVTLTRQLLGLARGGKYEVRATDLNRLVRQSADMFGRTRKEIVIREDYEAGLWSVDADRGQIQQVLLNLFINAWHAMPDGGDLAIETRNVRLGPRDAGPYAIDPGRYVRVSITDTGCGIAPANLRKIFDPFFTTKGVGKGSGLGLASAYGIIKNHQGTIDVTSEPGRGSRFLFFLPASGKAVADDASEERRLTRGSETILLVDDEEMILTVTEEMLSTLGYTVMTAGSGEAALALYRRQAERIDLVILDMIMPQMSGRELCDQLKILNPAVKVLLASGYSIDGQVGGTASDCCSGFVQKPYSLGDLSIKVRRILDGPA